jgi:hypothetical protein
MPKSITFACGTLPVPMPTRMLEGLMSRWMIPRRWAWVTASQTWRKSARRSRTPRPRRSQKSVIGSPSTNSIANHGRPPCTPPSKIRATWSWLIDASTSRSWSKRAIASRGLMPEAVSSLSATLWRKVSRRSASHTSPMAPSSM